MVCVPLPPVRCLRGQPQLPHDKSISHRALMLAAVAHGPSALHHLAEGEDVARTCACLRALGADISAPDARGITHVMGRGPEGLRPPSAALDCGNSGTTLRLMMGLLAGLGLAATLVGDASLSRRPMKRVAEPLRAMGARLTLTGNDRAPVQVHAAPPLRGVPHHLALPSGQLKGALLLAGLHAQGTSHLRGALGGRDHTERLLRAFGAEISAGPEGVTLEGGQKLTGTTVRVPKDFSAAAFWLGAGLLVEQADLTLTDVGLNPSRTGLLWALQQMGADVGCSAHPEGGEPRGTLQVRGRAQDRAPLRGVHLHGERIAPMIDELPLLMVLATQAHGTTVLRDAQELRVKETDRLQAMADNLARMGAPVALHADGCTIMGPRALTQAALHSFGDHRIAMALGVATLICPGTSTLEGAECMAISDPYFMTTRAALQQQPAPHPSSEPVS